MPRKRKIYSTLGVSGLSRWGSEVTEEFLVELRGEKGRLNFKNMSMTDATSGSVLFVIKAMIRSGEWDVWTAKGDNSTGGKKAAEFTYENLFDMSRSWPSTVSSICSMFTYGFDFREICWKQRLGRYHYPESAYDDGMIGLHKLATRSQTTILNWKFAPDGTILGAIQTNPETRKGIYIPLKKALLFRVDEDSDSPESRSILANSYISWYYLKNFQVLEGIGVERDLSGIPYIRVPAEVLNDADKATQLADLKNLVSNLRNDEQSGVLLPYDSENPDMYKLELIGSPGEKQHDVEKIIHRCKTEIAQAALSDFILMGQASVGSYALSRTKEDAVKISVKAYLENISGVINSHLIPKLMQLNPEFRSLKKYPRCVTRLAKVPTFDELTNLIRSLAFAGFYIAADLDIFNDVLSSYGLPILSKEQYAVLVKNNIEGKIYPSLGSLDDRVEDREEREERGDDNGEDEDEEV